ncbi:response regulator transcription factor [Clostridium botulinum]|uniref:Stage 0 sporulation protein A homolog n=1 Tax=Clostridium botulinum TaxID=1491 RepID=A0A846J800_CLOBO|nr:response regulator transcription factor [Clostridium botulinum]ACA54388.1 transcriptional regulatory protein DegU [Clostridium botulinum A3 str. Loch Maree]NFH65913.1 response regulator transcription factor [Clostridium botulinum]NFJ10208.1 response regulator transcription factor [Clostridium botulinum]NFK16430.1 response regulator transcription factor [Clostridium botulinum]NFM94006.1 response regulator transcription factor [Clostridium botulinum]
MINVIVADDQKIVRDGITMILSLYEEINIIGEAENGKELIMLLEKSLPDVILMDIRMPIMDGVEATKIVKEKYKNVKVIILTTFNEDEYIFKPIKYGADGYLLKDAGSEYIIEAIKSVYNGAMLLDPEVTVKVVKAFNSITEKTQSFTNFNKIKYELDALTPREREVAKLVSQGKSNKDICNILFLTEGTVKNYVTRILEKLELNNRTELALFINQDGL